MIDLSTLIFLGGLGHFGVLIASALVPFKLDWSAVFSALPKLHRQMYWTYGGYVVLAIVAFGVIATTCSAELASGTRLARAVCGFIAVFWAIRLALQPVFDVKPFLTAWWLRAGYHTLTVVFVLLVAIFGWAALAPRG
ncbi:MAG: hypothetical protein AAGB29_00300 [Planctomycetota bacterium]